MTYAEYNDVNDFVNRHVAICDRISMAIFVVEIALMVASSIMFIWLVLHVGTAIALVAYAASMVAVSAICWPIIKRYSNEACDALIFEINIDVQHEE